MKHKVTLTITSLLSIVLFSFHLTEDFVRGFEPGNLSNYPGILILAVWLYATLVLAERRSGLVILLLASVMGAGVPILHMSGAGLVGGRIANSSGVFFWVWTLLALGTTSLISLVLSVRGLLDPAPVNGSPGLGIMSALLSIHVAAGGLALVLGAVALSVKKGGTIHRRSGLLFVYAMLVMAISGAFLGNVFGGLMTIYFVVTALTTVRPVTSWTRGINVAAMLIAVAFTLVTIPRGVKAFNSPGRALDGVPFAMLFALATVAILAILGDLRVLRFGVPRGGRRLARHLWRMCFALFIAAGSFFSIRARVAKVLPEPFTSGPMRALPILLLFGAMFYWLWRVRSRRPLPARVRHDPMPD